MSISNNTFSKHTYMYKFMSTHGSTEVYVCISMDSDTPDLKYMLEIIYRVILAIVSATRPLGMVCVHVCPHLDLSRCPLLHQSLQPPP